VPTRAQSGRVVLRARSGGWCFLGGDLRTGVSDGNSRTPGSRVTRVFSNSRFFSLRTARAAFWHLVRGGFAPELDLGEAAAPRIIADARTPYPVIEAAQQPRRCGARQRFAGDGQRQPANQKLLHRRGSADLLPFTSVTMRDLR
jgi:hypothetical protein